MKPIELAIAHCGNQSILAMRIGVKPQVVHNWLRRGNVPADHCPAIESATNGKVTCEDLRPDVPWHLIRRKDSVGESKKIAIQGMA